MALLSIHCSDHFVFSVRSFFKKINMGALGKKEVQKETTISWWSAGVADFDIEVRDSDVCNPIL